MACPLFFSGDMGDIDGFTRGLLCNPEMIAVNQDVLGRCAAPESNSGRDRKKPTHAGTADPRPDCADQLKRKFNLLNARWRDYERLFTAPIQ